MWHAINGWSAPHQGADNSIQSSKAVTELVLIVRLFGKLTQCKASIGQDLLRVKQTVEQLEDEEDGTDALGLVCRVTNSLCQMKRPSVELLGKI